MDIKMKILPLMPLPLPILKIMKYILRLSMNLMNIQEIIV